MSLKQGSMLLRLGELAKNEQICQKNIKFENTELSCFSTNRNMYMQRAIQPDDKYTLYCILMTNGRGSRTIILPARYTERGD